MAKSFILWDRMEELFKNKTNKKQKNDEMRQSRRILGKYP